MRALYFTGLITLLTTSHSFAQDFTSFKHQVRVEISLDVFNIGQNGEIYSNYNGHDPVLYYDPQLIDQGSSCPGVGVRAWYAVNFATASFEKFGIGFETGMHVNAGRANQSVIPQDDPKGTNLRFPILISMRHGSCVDRRYYGKFGFCLAAGVEILRSSIPNETGTYILPKIEGMINVKKVNFFVGVYPVSIKSYYQMNGERVLRQKTLFYDFGVRFGITRYAKPYRGDKKLELFETR